MSKQAKKAKLLDFDFVGEEHFSLEDMLHNAYLEGKKDFQKELVQKLQKGLQHSAVTSSLFKEKLKDAEITVKDMFLRIVDFSDFECLVVIDDPDYYDKDKRWKAYGISRNINENIDDININFSLMPFSEEMSKDTMISEGFCYKYAGNSEA